MANNNSPSIQPPELLNEQQCGVCKIKITKDNVAGRGFWSPDCNECYCMMCSNCYVLREHGDWDTAYCTNCSKKENIQTSCDVKYICFKCNKFGNIVGWTESDDKPYCVDCTGYVDNDCDSA